MYNNHDSVIGVSVTCASKVHQNFFKVSFFKYHEKLAQFSGSSFSYQILLLLLLLLLFGALVILKMVDDICCCILCLVRLALCLKMCWWIFGAKFAYSDRGMTTK